MRPKERTMTSLADVKEPVSEDELARLMDYPDSAEEIPTLDVAPYFAGEKGGLEAVAKRLAEITETIGFFYLKGHGVSQDLIDRVFAQSRRIHSLPVDVKEKLPYTVNESFRTGYQFAGAAKKEAGSNVYLIGKTKPNLLSKFSALRDQTRNVWPENLPGFKETLLEYQARIEQLGRSFLPIWSQSLDLPLDYFDKYFESPQCTLNLLHYAPQTEIGQRQYGIAPHTDNCMMTFLAQANVGGLAVRMPSGHWRLVDVIPGTFLVNTGNVMVRWTNDRYLSTKHRVINTATVDRYSIPVFFGPSSDSMIEVVPSCQGPDNPAKYEPINYVALRKWYYGYRD
jgi:isopenicillin N synthase-like dioxygenase